MTDPRVMLQGIMQTFAANNSRWIKREVGNVAHALDDAEHAASLETLMGVLCEAHNALPVIPDVTPGDVGTDEIERPGR